MPVAAAIYCRISSDPRDSRLGVKRQEQDCRDLAERKGWAVAEVFVDNDVSASKDKRRPAYEQMLDAIKGGKVDAVLCWDADRLHRRPLELETFFTVCDSAGLTHLATVGGEVDLATGEGVLVMRIKGAVAADEARKISVRAKRKKRELAERGEPAGGGKRAFGYERDGRTVIPVEAHAVAVAAESVLAGRSLRSVARVLDEVAPPVSGGSWRLNSLVKMLRSARIAGLREYHGRLMGEATWPALVDRETWDRLRVMLSDPARRTNRGARSHLLSGVLFCVCGGPMTGNGRWYRCRLDRKGCGKRSVLSAMLDAHVEERVRERLDSPDYRRALSESEPDHSATLATIDAEEAKLLELADMWDSQVITRDEWLRLRARVEHRLTTARAKLGTAVVLPDVPWDQLDLPAKHGVLAVVIQRIVISPVIVPGRHVFEPERVAIHWQ